MANQDAILSAILTLETMLNYHSTLILHEILGKVNRYCNKNQTALCWLMMTYLIAGSFLEMIGFGYMETEQHFFMYITSL